MESSLTINQNVDQLFLEITRIIFIVNDFILPFILGEYNISLSDFWQYSADLSADIHSFLKSNSKEWKKHMKLENDASKAKKPVIITTSLLSLFIPIISIPFFIGGVGGGFSLYRKIQKIRREKIKSSFSPTIYPFIWDKNLVNIKQCLYNMNRIKQIGWKNDILIIFYEQNGNDSSLLFRSLTGYNVDFTNQDRISQLFSNVSIKAFMERFKRYGKTHTSNLEKLRVNILYLKGYSQNDIRYICHAQNKNPIFVSSIVEGQSLEILPEQNYMFYIFFISLNCYQFNVVNKKNYLLNLRSDCICKIIDDNEINYGQILPVKSKDLKFADAGPVTNSLIKYGCRFILQDISLDLNDQNE